MQTAGTTRIRQARDRFHQDSRQLPRGKRRRTSQPAELLREGGPEAGQHLLPHLLAAWEGRGGKGAGVGSGRGELIAGGKQAGVGSGRGELGAGREAGRGGEWAWHQREACAGCSPCAVHAATAGQHRPPPIAHAPDAWFNHRFSTNNQHPAEIVKVIIFSAPDTWFNHRFSNN